jgi:hypothetical protein
MKRAAGTIVLALLFASALVAAACGPEGDYDEDTYDDWDDPVDGDAGPGEAADDGTTRPSDESDGGTDDLEPDGGAIAPGDEPADFSGDLDGGSDDAASFDASDSEDDRLQRGGDAAPPDPRDGANR